MRWSVGIEVQAREILTREQVVELADAVAVLNGIATGIGTDCYGAQLIVEAGSCDAAMELGTVAFMKAAAAAGLPQGRVLRVEAVSEIEEE